MSILDVLKGSLAEFQCTASSYHIFILLSTGIAFSVNNYGIK